MMTSIARFVFQNFRMIKNRGRKGLDKPVFIVAAITLAIIFVSIYFASVSGWMDGALGEFADRSSKVGPDP